MEYINLYRKYRPRLFRDVRGQDHIVKTLQNSILTNKISHAYLFTGPRGIGKTSVAKIFASAINCYHRIENQFEPCESCIKNLNHSFDIIEMDGASNNSVEDIKNLKEKALIMPEQGKYKIYIIDEVHTLSKMAFNALLKILEEPPQHIIFILATTDAQKIPATILSRVIRFNFRLMTRSIIVKQLKSIFKVEQITYEDQVLDYIAKLSLGGMRDALSIADQAISFGNHHIKLDDLMYAFSIVSNENLIFIVNSIAQQNAKPMIELLERLHQSGIETEKLIYSLIDVLNDFVVYKITKNTSLLSYLLVEQINDFIISQDQARKYIFELYEILKRTPFIENNFEYLQIKLLELTYGLNYQLSAPISPEKTTDKSQEILEKFTKSIDINTQEKQQPNNNDIQQNINKIVEKIVENEQNTKGEKPFDIQQDLNKIEDIESQTQELINSYRDFENILNQNNYEQQDYLNNNSLNLGSNDDHNLAKTKIDKSDEKVDKIKADNNVVIDRFDLNTITSVFLQRDKNLKESDKLGIEKIKLLDYDESFDFESKTLLSINDFQLIKHAFSKFELISSSKDYLLLSTHDEDILNFLRIEAKKARIQTIIKKVINTERYLYLISSTMRSKLFDNLKAITQNPSLKPPRVEIKKTTSIKRLNDKKEQQFKDVFNDEFISNFVKKSNKE